MTPETYEERLGQLHRRTIQAMALADLLDLPAYVFAYRDLDIKICKLIELYREQHDLAPRQ